MKSAGKISPVETGGSWRSIRQDVKSDAMSRKGRRRRLIAWTKVAGLCAVFGTAGWAIYSVIYSWETDRVGLASAVHSEPLKEIAVLTPGGVLDKKWVIDTLQLPKNISLMALELPELREKLLESKQAQVVVLTRSFPDTLVVTLKERSPVARIFDGGFDAREWLVAKDGTVYLGVGYSKELLASLPVLDGVTLVKDGAGFKPIAGMEEVSSLLSTAQLQAPHLYREWLIVSMAHFDDNEEIAVQAKTIPKILFSRKLDFYKQIARLDYIIDRVHTMPDPVFKSVNLTIENQVPVELEQTPDELAGAGLPNSKKNLPPIKRKRDL
ncbi:cell division protein FtsQ/DivIB [Oleiharenicola lentus]|uniref:cell division protein FtsQ/DivIB n=1 Tax=Oleiharenicola lentus TaxID=2508720 RepID=UPI003F67C417